MTEIETATLPQTANIGEINKYDFHTKADAVFKARKGLDADIVCQISERASPGGGTCSRHIWVRRSALP